MTSDRYIFNTDSVLCAMCLYIWSNGHFLLTYNTDSKEAGGKLKSIRSSSWVRVLLSLLAFLVLFLPGFDLAAAGTRRVSHPRVLVANEQKPYYCHVVFGRSWTLVDYDWNKRREFYHSQEMFVSKIELKSLCDYYFDGKGKAIRPMIVVLMARALNIHSNRAG